MASPCAPRLAKVRASHRTTGRGGNGRAADPAAGAPRVAEAVQRRLRRGIGRPVDDEPLARVRQRVEHLEVDVHTPEHGMEQALAAAPVDAHVALLPQPGELRAAGAPLADPRPELLVVGLDGPRGTQVGDAVPENLLPVQVDRTLVRVEQAQLDRVAAGRGQRVEVEHQPGHLPVPREEVEPVVEQHGGQRGQVVHQPHRGRLRRGRRRRPAVRGPPAGQVEQVGALVAAQPQRPGQGLQHARRRVEPATLLQRARRSRCSPRPAARPPRGAGRVCGDAGHRRGARPPRGAAARAASGGRPRARGSSCPGRPSPPIVRRLSLVPAFPGRGLPSCRPATDTDSPP